MRKWIKRKNITRKVNKLYFMKINNTMQEQRKSMVKMWKH